MADEIEKKFLLKYLPKDLMINGTQIAQGYMRTEPGVTIRVRLAGDKAFLTLKGKTVNASRKEYEYPVPVEDAKEMLDLFCKKPFVEKIRFNIEYKGFIWELDQFSGNNQGLVVAEIELEHIDQKFEIPDWVGEEVTHDARYYNANLINNPFCHW